ncbi:MAG: TIGR04283 family arsenosugar biosynthesis glycosyltransferase [Blastocatellia bacterium]
MSNSQSISIVIPVFNEEAQIAETLAGLKTEAGQRVELVVADGGSHDYTAEIARSFKSVQTVVCGRANRGWQMNEGVKVASGEILLFLHADVKLPDGSLDSIRQALNDERMLGGCFQIRFPADARDSLRLVAWGINLRTRWFKTATGDQAIFVRRRIFDEIGGYETFPLMEDIALFNELKRRGQVVVLNGQVEISPRRWLKFGVWRTVLLMYALRLGYWLGIHPATLKKFFIDVR